MSLKLNLNTFAENACAYQQHQKALRTELRYFDLLKKMKGMSSSEASLSLQANGDKLSRLTNLLYARFIKTQIKTQLTLKQAGGFSAGLLSSSADEELADINQAANRSLNEILGADHGIQVSHPVKWKNPIVSFSELLDNSKQLLTCFLEEGVKKLGCRVVERKFQLVYLDEITKKLQKPDSRHVDCLLYALYRLNVLKAVEAIFFGRPLFSEISCDQYLEVLIDRLGFHLVDTPQKGDMIIYLNQKEHVEHVGVMVDAETVHSKAGGMDEIIEHPIQSVSKNYRYTYAFLRQENGSLDKYWALKIDK